MHYKFYIEDWPNYTKVKNLYKNLKSYAEVGKVLGLSRQRIHQIIKQYRNIGKKGREELYKERWHDICQMCNKNKSDVLHHIDFNNKNDTLKNLIALCKDCHIEVHKNNKLNKRYNGKCLGCKKNFSKNMPHHAKRMCSKCYRKAYMKKMKVYLTNNNKEL